ncbi:MAG: hypothetical protein ACRDE5_10360 [Ginsengibacter sp.]
MGEEMPKLSLGRKLILLTAGHITLNGALLAAGKELFLEAIPPARLLFMPEIADEISEVIAISLNTLPLTIGVTYIIAEWKNSGENKLLVASVILWICMFIGCWLHLGINYAELFPDAKVSLRDFLLQGNIFIQLLIYPLVVFYQVYGFVLFFTSVLVGYVASGLFGKKQEKK